MRYNQIIIFRSVYALSKTLIASTSDESSD